MSEQKLFPSPDRCAAQETVTERANPAKQTDVITIIFVDDEPNVLSGYRRMLRGKRSAWNLNFANGGEEALEFLKTHDVDIIVSDMRMPGMGGGELLTRVKQEYPHTIRMALSGYAETETELECAQVAHQFLLKPIEGASLVETLELALSLRSLLSDKGLQKTVAGLSSLPSLPTLYHQVLKEASSEQGSMASIAEIIAGDIAMTAKILQLVNSAFFGVRRHITELHEAVMMLGIDTIKSLVVSVHLFSSYESRTSGGLDLQQLTTHSQHVGNLASRIAKFEKMPKKLCDLSLLAGMLHDIGRLVLANSFPDEYQKVITLHDAENLQSWECETQVFGASHAEIGCYLAGLWSLPNPIIEALAYHHQPERSPAREFSPLTAVHIANALYHHLQQPDLDPLDNPYLSRSYLQQLNVEGHLQDWNRIGQAFMEELAP